MRTKEVSALVLAIAVCFPCGATETRESEPGKAWAGVSTAALIAAAVAAALAGGGGDDGGQAPSGSPGSATRTLSYTSAADFRTFEYNAQDGLGMVRAESLYYNGHYRWYVGAAGDPAAGTGVGVKIAVADTGIDAGEAATGGRIAIDGAASYDYVSNRPGSGADDSGHGTHVAGIIAAPKNGAGMHGLAYNASIVNFKVGDADGFITASDAQLGDMMVRAANAGAMIINNSWGWRSAITSYSSDELLISLPRMIEAARAYVAKGGVVVFAAGNQAASQPSVQAGLPHRIAGIAPGWLAVVAIDGSGALAAYSNRCGVAAPWCLAAPGSGVYSMYDDGGYASMSGTSMAAPHAAAALGALKSMFPNLGTLQLRDRLLYTANRSGRYADAAAYGQGLMDLAAASSPVGGISVPTGSSATGPSAPVEGSGIEFQAGALQALGMQGAVLVVDNYQRAPFWVASQAFFRETKPRLVERHLASLRSPLAGKASPRDGLYRFAFSTGTGGEALLGSDLALAWIPRLASPAVDSPALGYSSQLGGVRFGLLATFPRQEAAPGQVTLERTLDSSTFGSRRALAAVAQRQRAATTYGLSFAVAERFERPLGIATSGAFGVDDSAAVSSGAFVQHALDRSIVLDASLETAYHRAEASGALTAPDYAVHSASFGIRHAMGAKTTLSADLRRDWSSDDSISLHVPLTINEAGDIGRVAYSLPYDALIGRTAFSLRLDHRLTRQASLRAGLTHERNGFGVSITGIAAVLELTY